MSPCSRCGCSPEPGSGAADAAHHQRGPLRGREHTHPGDPIERDHRVRTARAEGDTASVERVDPVNMGPPLVESRALRTWNIGPHAVPLEVAPAATGLTRPNPRGYPRERRKRVRFSASAGLGAAWE
ncbi:hypothetical protein GCM10027026_23470 [Myroides odoratimimus subsp. xuanwuensis]